MTQEVRSILFSAEEVHAAVVQLMTQRVRGLKPHWVERVTISVQADAVHATVQFCRELATSRVLEPNELMSAMLLYCRKEKIPLSNRAQKRLSVVNKKLVLTTAINLTRIDPFVQDGLVIHAVAEPGLADAYPG